ncbi:beta-ketoacyl synthase [Marinimicrobium sp. ABcell2]|uniref:beta-ketoacyl synthase n=1 Tax=Marinimicrobium sp. ABcell2 TaxID=3069751 RepID=UPI0027AE0FD6|nr:beta-ketoacyl synthase [Marinimicrobium sp. ABcell2]MDQ2077298.1 beta-ketoacyl synthase [Marinimicrobium sp. ABcell2]
MSALPVIVGFGGFNAAGRASGHHAYRRMVLESLPDAERQETLAGLAVMMGLVTYTEGAYRDSDDQACSLVDIEARFGQQVLDGTLIRRIEAGFFDVDAVPWQKSAVLAGDAEPLRFEMDEREVPEPLPADWKVVELDNRRVQVTVAGPLAVKLDSYRDLAVKSAGQLPAGFDPGALYNSRFHPRALQLAVIGASDAVQSVGIPWAEIASSIRPDQVSVYASNVMSQMDEAGFGGLLQSRLKGSRVSTKQCPLGLNSMPADFVNAYIIGSVGHTGAIAGACASFLYNLSAAVEDIVNGRCRVAIVGNAEAPITSEIIDGYATMGALAQEDKLKKIDGGDTTDLRRSSRPFGENCGFTIAEASTYVVLMDDALALELGADIHGAVNDVFINADGFKKSISAPGPGNYITMAKAVASARAIVGDEGIRERSMVQAHGSSTPQNRVSESEIFDRVARVFGIENWPVSAVKAFVGHSLSPASGEQLITSLGVFKHGWIPGIKTIDRVADDVLGERLQIPLADLDRRDNPLDVVFLNSKGFGGNNATASVLAPRVVDRMMRKRHGESAVNSYVERRESVRARAAAYDAGALQGRFDTIYQFGEGLIDEADLTLSDKSINVPGFEQEISLELPNRFADMT